MIQKVKRAENFIIRQPYVVGPEETIDSLMQRVQTREISTYLVTTNPKRKHKMSVYSDKENILSPKMSGKKSTVNPYELLGIVTNRDLRAARNKGTLVKDVMTPREKLVVYEKPENEKLKQIDQQNLYNLMIDNRIEKLPIVNEKNRLIGLATEKDLRKRLFDFRSNIDSNGSLMVGAAVGCRGDYLERAFHLVNSGVDFLCVDVANGHNQMTIDAVDEIKKNFPKVDILAGNVVSGEGAHKLIEAGADGIRCGIGNGSICITRIVSGCGVPQFTALTRVAPVCKEHDVPLMSDGGNKNSGNMCKALAIGADCIMLGRLVAGTEESPGLPFLKDGNLIKITRGMAGFGANLSKAQKVKGKKPDSLKFSAEGVEGFVPYAGKLKPLIHRFVMGIRSGMSYMGAKNLKELREKVRFTIISRASIAESNVHGIRKFK